MTVVLWILVGVLWTILVIFVAYWLGVTAGAKDAVQQLSKKEGIVGPPGPPGADGMQGEKGDRGPRGEAATVGLDLLAERITDLEARDAAYQDRFRRVERKAGLSV